MPEDEAAAPSVSEVPSPSPLVGLGSPVWHVTEPRTTCPLGSPKPSTSSQLISSEEVSILKAPVTVLRVSMMLSLNEG